MLSSVWLLLAAGRAVAAPELFVDLKYDADPALRGCPGETEFRSMVAKRVGYDPFRSGTPLTVEVRAKRGDLGLDGAIDWSAAARARVGERRFVTRNHDCQELATTMAFVLAVQVQLMATEPPPDETTNAPGEDDNRGTENGGTSLSDATAAAASASSEVLAEQTAPPSHRWMASAGAGVSYGARLAPSGIFLGRLFLALQYGPAIIEVGAEASLPSTKRQDYGGGFEHELILGTLALCGEHWSFSLCGLSKLGVLRVSGVGVDESLSPAGFLAQVGPRLAYRLKIAEWLDLMGHGDALYLLTPWTVDTNHTLVWTMPRVGAVVGIDLVARFK